MSEETELKTFIIDQLKDMAKTIVKNTEKNIKSRTNNPFNSISDEVGKHMGLGRSFDSQLGTRLQKIALYLARRKYGKENVPNIILMSSKNNQDIVNVVRIAYDLSPEFGMTQKVYWKEPGFDFKGVFTHELIKLYKKDPSKFCIKNDSIHCTIDEILTIKNKINEIDENGNGIPVDLVFFDKKDNAHTFELKAGGNLDTKNTKSNVSEVENLKLIFKIFGNNESKFATCYNNNGEGNTPKGTIFNKLSSKEQAVGKNFWEEILPKSLTYDKFIQIYHKAFKEAKVEETIVK
ncbi:TdeIII family type II restriction endonuclease [Lactobacillus sp. ESL0684]|uniref:TdeIII family type II restriction endonuclease n=1 Tax=Lactobacillus sp. ESL0684 TaxID=2983213 RepID=UPI0023F7D6D9|nr:TdeIII family type II restriction endonuclease [Lactobacillus sp. ESL0684]WEV43776.1 TdeIII family type II restriction endonuclease [Lactobacillus sp. ESL0684]